MVYIKLLLAAMFWGGTFIAGRSIAGNVNPLNASFLRFAMASLFLLIITRQQEGRLPVLGKKQILPVLLLGATGVFAYNILFFSAFQYITAGKASLIIATNPIVITIFSVLIFKEPINIIKCLGIGISVIGALVVISDGHLSALTGDQVGLGEILIMGCVVSWVIYSLIGKKVMGGLSPLVSVCYSSVAGTILLFFPALIFSGLSEVRFYGFSQWGALFYLAFFGTVLGFLWYYEGIKSVGAMRAGVFINFVPVSAVTLAWFILGEPVSLAQLMGAGLVMLGIYAGNASSSFMKKRPALKPM